MNAIRDNRSLRIVAILATFIGWFVRSNHCALGRMASRAGTQTAHGCCHNGASQPVKEPAEGGRSVECCKSLHVLVPDGAGLPAASSLEIFALPVAGPVFAIALPEVHPHRRGKRPSARVNATAHKVTAGIFKIHKS